MWRVFKQEKRATTSQWCYMLCFNDALELIWTTTTTKPEIWRRRKSTVNRDDKWLKSCTECREFFRNTKWVCFYFVNIGAVCVCVCVFIVVVKSVDLYLHTLAHNKGGVQQFFDLISFWNLNAVPFYSVFRFLF